MYAVTVDNDNQLVTAQPGSYVWPVVRTVLDLRRGLTCAGINLGCLYYILWNQSNLVLPGGSCNTVGLGGHVLGGGYGLMARQFGVPLRDSNDTICLLPSLFIRFVCLPVFSCLFCASHTPWSLASVGL